MRNLKEGTEIIPAAIVAEETAVTVLVNPHDKEAEIPAIKVASRDPRVEVAAKVDLAEVRNAAVEVKLFQHKVEMIVEVGEVAHR